MSDQDLAAHKDDGGWGPFLQRFAAVVVGLSGLGLWWFLGIVVMFGSESELLGNAYFSCLVATVLVFVGMVGLGSRRSRTLFLFAAGAFVLTGVLLFQEFRELSVLPQPRHRDVWPRNAALVCVLLALGTPWWGRG